MFDRSNDTGSVDVKMDGSVHEEISSFKILGLTSFAKLDCDSNIIAKIASKKIGALICSVSFLSAGVALCLNKSTIRTCMEYCCHVWVGAPD